MKVFHLCADQHGCERTGTGLPGRHIKDVLREIHGRLVNEGCRDEITLIVSGGIALAEHMAKAIICGADLVAVDTALLVALGCRVCRDAHTLNIDGGALNAEPPSCACPAEVGSAGQRLCSPAHGQSYGRLAQPADRSARRHGHPRSPPAARRDGTSHFYGRDRERGIRRFGSDAAETGNA